MKLIPGTLHVYPLNDYGAVEVCEHRLFQLLPGKPEKLVEVSPLLTCGSRTPARGSSRGC
jgi:hypothetical protein